MEVTIYARSRSDGVNEFLNAIFSPEKAILEELITKYRSSPRGLIELNEIVSILSQNKRFEPIQLDNFFKKSQKLKEIFEYISQQQELLLEKQRCESIEIGLKTRPTNNSILSNEYAPTPAPSNMRSHDFRQRGPMNPMMSIHGGNYPSGCGYYQPNFNPNFSSLYPGMIGPNTYWHHHPLNVNAHLAFPTLTRNPGIPPLPPVAPAHRPLTLKLSAQNEGFDQRAEARRELNSRLTNVYTYSDFFKSDGSQKYPQPPSIAHERDYECQKCGKRYLSQRSLYNHIRIHQTPKNKDPSSPKDVNSEPNTKYICGTCGKAFDEECELKLHARRHSKFKPYGCGHCGKSFTDKTRLRDHTRSHSTNRTFKCTDCERTFVHKGHLTRHRKTSCNLNDEAATIEIKGMDETSPQQQEIEPCAPESPPLLSIEMNCITPPLKDAELGDSGSIKTENLSDCLSQAPLPPTPLFPLSEFYSDLASMEKSQESPLENESYDM